MTLPTKTFVTGKARVLAVKFPEVATRITFDNETQPNIILFTDKDGFTCWSDVPKGDWQMLFRAVDATEEEAKNVVDEFSHTVGWRADDDDSKLPKITLYQNYDYKIPPLPVSFLCNTAIESLQSLLRANEIYTENPLGEMPNESNLVEIENRLRKTINTSTEDGYDKMVELADKEFDKLTEQWELAQQNTGNWHLMIEPL